MIYLIDDNQKNLRLYNYNITYTDDATFRDILISKERLNFVLDPYDINHLVELKQASCILLHINTEDCIDNQFIPGSKSNVLKIKEMICNDGINVPLVLFSNEMGEADYNPEERPYIINSLNKNIFYTNLYDFLINYRETGTVEFSILAWGKNYQFNRINKYANKIKLSMQDKNEQDFIDIRDILVVYEDFRKYIAFSFNDKLDINQVLIDIEDNPTTVKEFKSKINNICNSFIKYGKNIYNW